jgi:hypothetical protein
LEWIANFKKVGALRPNFNLCQPPRRYVVYSGGTERVVQDFGEFMTEPGDVLNEVKGRQQKPRGDPAYKSHCIKFVWLLKVKVMETRD